MPVVLKTALVVQLTIQLKNAKVAWRVSETPTLPGVVRDVEWKTAPVVLLEILVELV